ncbi:MAG: type I-E CRISPR-associated protein Cas5/CasD [Magnetococcales bacterium]|nr:type I-E CRISPR-associated protein Cas5/CasD [Magnetococcales bacterium]
MTEYLLFRLHGPMASWGRIAVGEVRLSDDHPTHSAMMGLLAAALGIRRHEEALLTALAEGYALAVRLDAPGELLRDYHTVQTPQTTDMKHRPKRCRSDQLTVPRNRLKTMLTTREYRCDAWYSVAIMARPCAPYPLQHLAQSLDFPRFPLYLGRKSCPLALPLRPQVLRAENLAAAFQTVQFLDDDFLAQQKITKSWLIKTWNNKPFLYWTDDEEDDSLEPLMSIIRRDHPLHRQRWQFAERVERQGKQKNTASEGTNHG